MIAFVENLLHFPEQAGPSPITASDLPGVKGKRLPPVVRFYFADDSCFLFTYEAGQAPDGHMTFPKMHLMNYESVTDYKSWEPARITSITMEPSLDDPGAELCVMKPLGAAYSINSNWVARQSPIGQFEGDKADALIPYLFAGRWDRSTISGGSQRYGQF